MSKFLDERLVSLKAYVPGEQPQDKKYIKLNTNESPFPPSPAMLAQLPQVSQRLNLYPDPEMKILCDELAQLCNVNRENIFVGNGSDEVLAFCFMAHCGKRAVRFADMTYGFYKVYADLFGIEKHIMPLREDFTIDIDMYKGTDDVIFIANPNAPTGIELPQSSLRTILEHTDAPVIIDEAYIDFGNQSCINLINEYDNLIVVRTFSKSRNLAGGRIGWAVGSKELINDLNTIKFSFNPYNVNMLSQCAAICAIRDKEYFEKCVLQVKIARQNTIAALKAMNFKVIDSSANFIFAAPPDGKGKELYMALKDKGILVRHFAGERTEKFIRITVGTVEQMNTFINTVKQIQYTV